MIEIITASGVSLDIDPALEFEIEIENPMLDDACIPIAYSTSIGFPPTLKNKRVFGFIDAMFRAPENEKIGVTIAIGSVPLFFGRIEYEGVEDGKINYTFAGRGLEDEWGGYIHKLEHLSEFIASKIRYIGYDASKLIQIQRGTIEDYEVDRGRLCNDFELPMIINKESVAEVEYSKNSLNKTAVSVRTKYQNYFWDITLAPVAPAVKVMSILSKAFSNVDISETIQDRLDKLAILALHKSRLTGQYGLQQESEDTVILPVADMLPECTILDLITNILRMYCASIFRDGSKFRVVTNKEVLLSSAILVWDNKIINGFSLTKEPATSYTFEYANGNDNDYTTETEGYSSTSEEGTITEVIGIEALMNLVESNASSYTTIRENRTGNIYSGKAITATKTVIREEVPVTLPYIDIIFNTQQKIVLNDKAEASFDRSIIFKCVECLPIGTSEVGTSSTIPVYHMCPILEFPAAGDNKRPTDIWIGSLLNGQLVDKGCAFPRPTTSGTHASVDNKSGVLDPNVSIAPESLYRRFHTQFANWLGSERKVISADAQLSIYDISTLRMYHRISVGNQLFLIKKITHTFSAQSDHIQSRVELMDCGKVARGTDLYNIITIEYWGDTVEERQFQLVAKYPVTSDILMNVSYQDWTTGSMVNKTTILRIMKGQQKSIVIDGVVDSMGIVAPLEDKDYFYAGGGLKYVTK